MLDPHTDEILAILCLKKMGCENVCREEDYRAYSEAKSTLCLQSFGKTSPFFCFLAVFLVAGNCGGKPTPIRPSQF
jgi:hypothetical protein